MGNQHVQPGDKVTYPVCPPASGKHINSPGKGPIQPKVYGPGDPVVPNGWVHNLEHGGLVLLYSCAKGACDATSTQALQDFYSGFPTSAICHLPLGVDWAGRRALRPDAHQVRGAGLGPRPVPRHA